MSIDNKKLRIIVEGALMAAGAPLSVQKILSLFDPEEGAALDLEQQAEKPSKEDVVAVLEDIQADFKGHGFELKEIGTGWRFQVVEETAPWVSKLWEEKPQKYSRALLETLALIAYRQPITRGDIESIRGVAVSSNIIKTLTEREWVKVVGHRDVPGRPALYATTREFLDYFNLKNLDELPSLREIQDLDTIDSQFDFSGGNVEQTDDGESAGEQEITGEQDTSAITSDENAVTDDVAETDHAIDSEAPGAPDGASDSDAEPEALDDSESTDAEMDDADIIEDSMEDDESVDDSDIDDDADEHHSANKVSSIES